MNKYIFLGVGFAIGAVTGSVATYFYLDKKLEKLYEDEIRDAKEVYERQRDRINRLVEDNNAKENKVLTDIKAAVAKSREGASDKSRPYTKYSSMFENKPELEELAAREHPVESDFDDQGAPFDPDGVDLSEGYYDDKVPEDVVENYIAERPKDRGVFILDDDESTFTGDPMYEDCALIYYEGDDTWTDENDEEVNILDLFDRKEILYAVIEKLDSQDAVYVKSNATMVIYECTKVNGTYTYHVLGMKE